MWTWFLAGTRPGLSATKLTASGAKSRPSARRRLEFAQKKCPTFVKSDIYSVDKCLIIRVLLVIAFS